MRETMIQPPIGGDDRSQYADEEPTAEQWATLGRQQHEDALPAAEDGDQ